MTKAKNIATAVAIAIPVIGLGIFHSKTKKLKEKGLLTSAVALIRTIPVMYRTQRYLYVEKKIKKNKYLLELKPALNTSSPSFRLCDIWKYRETDVICAVPAKSGTGWAQQICHQIRVGGDDSKTNFNQDLLDVTPWIETCLSGFFGKEEGRPVKVDPAAGPGALDINADHVDGPIRVFKSHLTWKAFQGTNCKKIYFYRNDVDAIYSGYRFFCGQILEVTDTCSAHQYATIQILKGTIENNLKNLIDFWENRNDPTVEFFFYDDVKEDHSGAVERIAKLMGVEPTPELVKNVVKQSTIKYMASDEHHRRFDEFRNIATLKRAVGFDISNYPDVSGQPPKGDLKNIKVPKGGGLGSKATKKKKAEPGRAEVEACYQKTWDRIILPKTGFADMYAMREAWQIERSKMSS